MVVARARALAVSGVGRGTVAKISDLSPGAIGQEDIPSSLGRDRWKWSLGRFHITELQT